MHEQLHPMTPHHLPFYIAKPGETDIWMIVMGVFLIAAVLGVGNIYLRLHSLPERMAHKSQKLQFEIVAVLGLLALFTHIHLFWIAALLLALDNQPRTPRRRGARGSHCAIRHPSALQLVGSDRPGATFFELSGQSIAAVQISAAVEEVLRDEGIEVLTNAHVTRVEGPGTAAGGSHLPLIH